MTRFNLLLPVVGIVIAVVACGPKYSAADIESAKLAGQPVVQRLMDYRRMHGHYPSSLQEAAVDPVITKLGVFEYERFGGAKGEYFVLHLGDHGRTGFSMFWNSDMASKGWLFEE